MVTITWPKQKETEKPQNGQAMTDVQAQSLVDTAIQSLVNLAITGPMEDMPVSIARGRKTPRIAWLKRNSLNQNKFSVEVMMDITLVGMRLTCYTNLKVQSVYPK